MIRHVLVKHMFLIFGDDAELGRKTRCASAIAEPRRLAVAVAAFAGLAFG
jgi:hypothetical protein